MPADQNDKSASKARTLFGQQLRLWRRRRGLSQLELSALAETTPRYVSFIETGRSRPGRELVLRLAACLDLPIREQNALLTAAGLQAVFEERLLDDQALRPFRQAVEVILARHEPYPAAALDMLGQVLLANESTKRLWPSIETTTPEENIDGMLGPGPGREAIANWADVAWAMADRLRHDAFRVHHPRLTALAERAMAHLEGVPRPTLEKVGSPVIETQLRVGTDIVSTFTTMLRFETAREVTISELRVELIFPVDERGDAFFRQMAADAQRASTSEA